MTKKWRWSIAIGVAVLGLILGSFLDLSFSQAIYTKGNWFGIGMAAFGSTPVYLFIGALGMGYVLFALRKETKTWLKVILWILAIGAFVCATHFQADMILSKNAFNIEDKWYIGYPAGLLITALGALIGYFLFRNVTSTHALITMIILPAILIVSYLCVDIVKRIMLRPRFRFLEGQGYLNDFLNWWESGSAFKDNLINDGVFTADYLKEEFRSFPSGHTVTTTCLVPFLAFLPQIDEKFKKYEPYLFYGALIWAMLMGFSRILIGAHFLSDVSMGALIAAVVGCLVDVFYFKNKKVEKTEKIDEDIAIENDVNKAIEEGNN